MQNRIILATLALWMASLPAHSATITLLGTNARAWMQVDTTKSGWIAPGATWTVAPVLFPTLDWPQIDPCVSACSPFDPGIYGSTGTIGADPLDGWQGFAFWAVWAGESNEAILSFGRPQRSLQLLWGSADATNRIEFRMGAVVSARLDGAALPDGILKHPGQGAALLEIVDVMFDSLRFSSDAGAFEISNITTSARVPVPGPMILLPSALLALGLVALRRRRAEHAAAPASAGTEPRLRTGLQEPSPGAWHLEFDGTARARRGLGA